MALLSAFTINKNIQKPFPFSLSNERKEGMVLLSAFTINKNIQKPFSSSSSHLQLAPSRGRVFCAHAKFEAQAYWTSINSDLSASLQAAISSSSSSSKVADILDRDPFRYTVLSTPVSLASHLCVAASELVVGEREPALPTACALHIMHAALEAHCRMPALFDVPVKLGRASTHVAFGDNFSLLAADALMPLAYQHIATASAHLGDRALRVVVELAKAVGSQGMVGGLYYELRNSLSPPPPSMAEASAEQVGGAVMEKKSALIGCGCACGGIIGGGSEEEIESLRRFGNYVGMLQQALNCVMEEEKFSGSSESACFDRDKALEVAEEMRGRAVKELAAFDKGKAAGLYGLVQDSLDHGVRGLELIREL